MNTYIKIKTQFEAYHSWPNAPEEVAFLRHLHRHLFKCVVKIEVNHSDRELEFFIFKKEVDKLIKRMLKSLRNEKSCEQMASWLLNKLKEEYSRYIQVEVSEDGENSAIVNNFDETISDLEKI